ncbi:TonB-dependent receptor plug domain-containing protein [Permianibacter aggregans]|uniref:Iron complex outermembrane receptor protein n=1 Tax=Permianibacter aggregans TaxID=1510150 RepID=A0A4R6UT14_9GAMM|nr:TonB-dependent receptor [Permianibacter aggregans]TDQ46534.1 iron complex outermembrane receptor protein [Permianibacter aggregans]
MKRPIILSLVLASSVAKAVEPLAVDDALFSDMPVVLTATRLKQPADEVPASVTVLDRELIRLSGARTLPELLRLVPGMHIGYENGTNPVLSYHGLVEDISRRMQVLIDGRAIFEPALARIEWHNIPLALDDIQRIEIVRGPNTALYGANAFFGVINIITVHPVDVIGNTISTTVGENGIRHALLRHADTVADGSFRLSLGHRGDDGFDLDRDGNKRYDSYQRSFFNADWQRTISERERVSLQMGYSRGTDQISLLDDFEPAPYHEANTEYGFLQGNWFIDHDARHQSKLQAYINYHNSREDWRTCIPQIFLSDELGLLYRTDRDYTNALIDAIGEGLPPPVPPSIEVAALLPAVFARFANNGLVPSCGTANQHLRESRFDIEWQETFVFSDAMRIVGGISARRDQVRSETYFGGELHNSLYRAFANLEWRLSENLISNLGGMYEYDDLVGGEFSPRLALNWQLAAQHTLRFIVARAVRTPDLFEDQSHYRYRIADLDTPVNGSDPFAFFYISAMAPGNLGVEEIWSREIGWNGRFLNQQLTIDVKLFDDELRDLMIGGTNLYNFDISNDGELRQRGAEFQLQWRLSKRWLLFAGYSLLDFDKATIPRYERSSAEHTSQALLAYQHPTGWEWSLAWHEMDNFWNQDFRLLRSRLAKSFQLASSTRLDLSLTLDSRQDRNYYFDDNNRQNDYNIAWMQATLSF